MTKTNMTTMTAMVSLMTMMTMVTMMNDYLVIKCNLVIKCYLNRYEKKRKRQTKLFVQLTSLIFLCSLGKGCETPEMKSPINKIDKNPNFPLQVDCTFTKSTLLTIEYFCK